MQLYQRIKSKFDFTVEFSDKFQVWETLYDGDSAIFRRSERKDFMLRMDVEKKSSEHTILVRLPLPNCAKYMYVVETLPEYVKESFRVSDCKCCNKGCPATMDYTFEGVNYRQCHFIALSLHSSEDLEHILALLFAEHSF